LWSGGKKEFLHDGRKSMTGLKMVRQSWCVKKKMGGGPLVKPAEGGKNGTLTLTRKGTPF